MSIEADPIIDEFFGDNPRAAEWRALREALMDRVRGLRRQRDSETDPIQAGKVSKQIADLSRQVATLETEEAISQFVEDSIKVSLARPASTNEEDGD